MPKMIPVKINGRWTLKLPEHRAARPEWTAPEGWEKPRLDHMRSTTKKDDIVIYIGAEEGDMCALLTKWGAHVAMFEPNPDVWSNIKAIWEANNLDEPYICYAGFAGPETTENAESALYMGKFPPSADGPVIAEHGFKSLHQADGSIPSIKLDVLGMSGLIPDMISIDVEGAEWEVLKGAESLLRNAHPRIYLSLHPEFLFEIYGRYAVELRSWIKQFGYKETLLDYQHEVHLVYEWEETND